MRPCAQPGCPVVVQGGRCPTHRAKVRQVEQRYTQGNYGRPWRRKREQFLEQSYPWFCAIQGSTCTARARMMDKAEVEVDHVVPHRGDVTLRDDLTNLQVTCKACHSAKTASEVEWKAHTR